MNNDFAGPIKLIDDNSQIERIISECNIVSSKQKVSKSLHEHSQILKDLASDPIILNLIKPILGENIMLWGCQLITSVPGHKHRWHIDVEHGNVLGVTVWIGLKNLNDKTLLKLISNTNDIKTSPQELAAKHGKDIYSNDDLILNKAKICNNECELIKLTPNVGECVMWKGRVWHSTENNSDNTRLSMILQYCSADNIPSIPMTFEYPNIKWSRQKHFCYPIKIE